jgi:hypothetical protein
VHHESPFINEKPKEIFFVLHLDEYKKKSTKCFVEFARFFFEYFSCTCGIFHVPGAQELWCIIIIGNCQNMKRTNRIKVEIVQYKFVVLVPLGIE